jgi:DnaJ-class molecular chaperone
VESLNYYEFLALPKSASASEIRVAYRRLAMRYHPDMNATAEAVARFNYLCQAYRCLSDPASRTAYDLELAARRDAAVSIEIDPLDDEDEPGETEDQSVDPVSPQTGRNPRPGATRYLLLRTPRRVPRNRLVVHFVRRDHCRRCVGSGLRRADEQSEWSVCHACWGTGQVDARRTLTIAYRSRRVLGGELMVPGEGDAGTHGGSRGNLILNILTPDHTTKGLLPAAVVAALFVYAAVGSLLVLVLGSCDKTS